MTGGNGSEFELRPSSPIAAVPEVGPCCIPRLAVKWNLLQPKGDHHGWNSYRAPRGSLEQGQARRPEGTIQTSGNLGYPYPPADERPAARSCPLRLGDRQQATGMQPGQAACPRR